MDNPASICVFRVEVDQHDSQILLLETWLRNEQCEHTPVRRGWSDVSDRMTVTHYDGKYFLPFTDNCSTICDLATIGLARFFK